MRCWAGPDQSGTDQLSSHSPGRTSVRLPAVGESFDAYHSRLQLNGTHPSAVPFDRLQLVRAQCHDVEIAVRIQRDLRFVRKTIDVHIPRAVRSGPRPSAMRVEKGDVYEKSRRRRHGRK